MRHEDAHDVVERHIDTGQPELLGRRVEVPLEHGWFLDVYLASERKPNQWVALITRFQPAGGEYKTYALYPDQASVTFDDYKDFPVDEHHTRYLSTEEVGGLEHEVRKVSDQLDREGKLK